MAGTNPLVQNELLAMEKPVARISWGGIFIGAIATLAVGILLHALGAAIGLTAINPARGEWGGNAGIWTGLWSFLSIVVATFLGALLASRASTVFFRRDGASLGFMTWALSFLAMLFFVAFAAGSAARAGTQLVGSGLEAAGAAAPAVQQELSQAQQQIAGQAQQAQPGQAATQAADVGAAAGWWFFVTALLGMGAGILGGVAGVPKTAKRLETRRTATVRPREA
ncbi:hypothetical protein [Vulgatibacter sp.]|uniref:hypothetical protein n=1 Tax=Vulgatibacter sp. TaxID=1971226 RepID=UPI00356316F4